MNPAETAAILRQFNEWRRGDEDIPQFDPREIGEAIDAAVEMIDRLEAAEKERDDVAQQLVQSEIGKREISEAHDALQVEVGKLKGLEVSRCVKINGYIVDNARLAEEVERLQAKVEQMERQEPVGWYSKQYGFVYMSRQPSQIEHGSILYLRNGAPAWRIEGSSKVALLDITSLPHGTVFYALPGAQTQGEGK